MNIPTSAASTLVIVYALHRLIEPSHSLGDDFLSFGVLMVLGFAAICYYIVQSAGEDRRRFDGMKF